MSYLVMRFVTAISLGFLTCCSAVPSLTSEPGRGPSVRQIVNHINCELASIIASNPSSKRGIPPFNYSGPIDSRIDERQAADGDLRRLLPYLQENHFVASVQLTLDTSDTEGIYPSTSFIHPFTASFNRTIGLGANLNGTQERNVSLGYSIDLANVADGCFPQDLAGPDGPLSGSLSLADIIADGLIGLDATSRVNVYSSGGPTRPAFDATLSAMRLELKCAGSPCSSPPQPPIISKGEMTLSGNLNFAPASDPQLAGTISFSGRAKSNDGDIYIMSLTGSTIEVGTKRDPKLDFTLSGTMTRETGVEADIAKAIGYNPNISLVGAVAGPPQFVTGLKNVRGLLTPSADVNANVANMKVTYNISSNSGRC